MKVRTLTVREVLRLAPGYIDLRHRLVKSPFLYLYHCNNTPPQNTFNDFLISSLFPPTKHKISK